MDSASIYKSLNLSSYNDINKRNLIMQQFNRTISNLQLSERMNWQQKFTKKLDLIEKIHKYKHMLFILSTINEQAHTQESELLLSSEELVLLKTKNKSQSGKLQHSHSLLNRMRKRDSFDRLLLIFGFLVFLSICGYIIYRRTAAHLFG